MCIKIFMNSKNHCWKGIAKRLVKLKNNDQTLRKNNADAIEIDTCDLISTTYIQIIISIFGFPKRSLIGEKGMFCLWILIQHAYKAVSFQKQCLKNMKKLLQECEIDKAHIAYLDDRIRVVEGSPQRYGTQYRICSGEICILPVDNIQKMHNRREKLGLESIRQYKVLEI